MKCTDINTRFDEYLDEGFSEHETHAFKDHVASCNSCRNSLEEVALIRRLAKDLPVEQANGDFEHRVFSNVRKQYPVQNNRFAAGFITAIAASLIFWVASIVLLPQFNTSQPQFISIALNDTQTIRLSFDAQSDIAQATVSINLPNNFELEGYPGYKNLTWTTSLKKGQNILTLPIMAVDLGEGELVAQLKYNGKTKTFKLRLKNTGKGVMNYQIQALKSV